MAGAYADGMETPENPTPDRLLRAISHMAEASGLAYSLVQELCFLQHELAPLTGGPLEPPNTADKAYPHVLNASMAAHRIIGDVAAVAAEFDKVLAADADEPVTRLHLAHPAGTAIGVGF